MCLCFFFVGRVCVGRGSITSRRVVYEALGRRRPHLIWRDPTPTLYLVFFCFLYRVLLFGSCLDLPCCSAPCWVDRYRVLPSFPSDLEAFLVITLYLVLPSFAVWIMFGFALLFGSMLGRPLPSFTEFSIGFGGFSSNNAVPSFTVFCCSLSNNIRICLVVQFHVGWPLPSFTEFYRVFHRRIE